MRAGHGTGHEDVSRRLTWRQIKAFFEAELAAETRGTAAALAAMMTGGKDASGS